LLYNQLGFVFTLSTIRLSCLEVVGAKMLAIIGVPFGWQQSGGVVVFSGGLHLRPLAASSERNGVSQCVSFASKHFGANLIKQWATMVAYYALGISYARIERWTK